MGLTGVSVVWRHTLSLLKTKHNSHYNKKPAAILAAGFLFTFLLSYHVNESLPYIYLHRQDMNKTDILAIIIRLIGLFIVLIGLLVSVKIFTEVWTLYHQPSHIRHFAIAIEQGSHLDAVIASLSEKATTTKPRPYNSKIRPQTKNSQPQLSVSYFIAWAIVVLLLFVLSHLATTAIRTGGQLALYDVQVKQLLRHIVKQSKGK